MTTKNTFLFGLAGFLVVVAALLFLKYYIPEPAIVNDLTSTPTSTPSNTVVVPAVTPYGKVTLHIGQTINFKNNSITLKRVVDDSRCATGVTCIWAGTLHAEILNITKDGTTTEIVELGKNTNTKSESIVLISASPYPKKSSTITPQDYSLVFDVSVRESVATLGSCYVGGCSSEVCSDRKDVASNCMYREVFACYKTAKCERQISGTCGWTETATLKACISLSSN